MPTGEIDMMNNQKIVFCTILIIGLQTICEAKDWRGIKPLHSTGKDVVRLLGRPVVGDRFRSVYRLSKEDVLIVYSGGEFCNPKISKVPAGTVLLIQVTPRSKPLFSELQIDRTRLREFSPSAQDPDWKGFIDEQEGFMVRNYKDRVDEIYYVAAGSDQARCSSYYSDLESFAQISFDFSARAFDEYSNLSREEEKARLDNFAIHLKQEKPTWIGYIVAYPSSLDVAAARDRSARAKEYLLSTGLDNKRVVTIIGGVRERAAIELYALPSGSPSPIPNPAPAPTASPR